MKSADDRRTPAGARHQGTERRPGRRPSPTFRGGRFATHPIAAAPASRGDYTWARLTASVGLVPGASRLGDELALLWTSGQIAQSVYAAHADAFWDGTAFTS